MHSAGLALLDAAETVVLETDGPFSVVRPAAGKGLASREGIQVPQQGRASAAPHVAPDRGA